MEYNLLIIFHINCLLFCINVCTNSAKKARVTLLLSVCSHFKLRRFQRRRRMRKSSCRLIALFFHCDGICHILLKTHAYSWRSFMLALALHKHQTMSGIRFGNISQLFIQLLTFRRIHATAERQKRVTEHTTKCICLASALIHKFFFFYVCFIPNMTLLFSVLFGMFSELLRLKCDDLAVCTVTSIPRLIKAHIIFAFFCCVSVYIPPENTDNFLYLTCFFCSPPPRDIQMCVEWNKCLLEVRLCFL